MDKNYSKLVNRLLALYPQEEVEAMLGVSYKSISNYLSGTAPTKRVRFIIDDIIKKVSENGGKPIPFKELMISPRSINATEALVRALLNEFADYKAQKEGLDPDAVRKDILSKARLVLNAFSDE